METTHYIVDIPSEKLPPEMRRTENPPSFRVEWAIALVCQITMLVQCIITRITTPLFLGMLAALMVLYAWNISTQKNPYVPTTVPTKQLSQKLRKIRAIEYINYTLLLFTGMVMLITAAVCAINLQASIDAERTAAMETVEPTYEPVIIVHDVVEIEDLEPEEVGVPLAMLKVYDVPTADTGFKAWMSYKSITSKTSMQWQLQQDAWTDEQGFRRYGDYYMVAMGTYYADQCGKLFHITLDSGHEFDAIIGDIKDDRHTDALHQHRNGNVVEFIVDTEAINQNCRRMGDMSWADGGLFQGKIESIIEIEPPTEVSTYVVANAKS